MPPLLLIFFLQYLMFIQISSADKNIQSDLIIDYVKNQNAPNSVTTYLCWEKDDLQNLAHKMFENGITFNINHLGVQHDMEINFLTLFNNIFVADLSCDGIEYLLEKANKEFFFREPNHWLLLLLEGFENNTDAHHGLFKYLDVFIDSRVIVIEKKMKSTLFVLNDVYKLRKDSEIITNTFGRWDTEKKEFDFLYSRESLSRRRRNIRHHLLKVSVVIMDNNSYAHLTDYRFNEVDTMSKLNFLLTDCLMEFLNATKKIIYVPTWYNQNTKDQNNTLVGTVVDKQVDITGTPFFCRKERLSWFDCIAMTTIAEGYFIFRQPPLSYVKNIYILPFGRNLWLADLAFFLLSSIFLFLVVGWEWKMITETDNDPEFDMIHATFSDALLFTMGAVCQQGYATEPKGTPGKILILTVFITLIFIFTAYTAYTVVLFQATANDIKTLKDLYDSKIELGLEAVPYFLQLFPTYTEPVRKKIYQDRLTPKGQPPHFYGIKEGMAKVRNEIFAFHTSHFAGYKVIHDTFMDTEKCALQQISYMYESNPWIVATKNSTFKKLFKIGYRKIHENGLLRREEKRRVAHKPECTGQGNNFRSAGLLDLYSVYMLLVIGVVSSIAMLSAEIILHKMILKRTLAI